MRPPVLTLNRLQPDLARVVGTSPELMSFVVLQAGTFAGRALRVGDHVICRRGEADGAIVLQPRGHGRPEVGHACRKALTGAWGEPCHPDRWVVAGAILAFVRRVGPRNLQVDRLVPEEGGQLGLFHLAA